MINKRLEALKKQLEEIKKEIEELEESKKELERQLAESEKNVQIEEMLKNYGKEEIKKLHKRINEIVERDKNIVIELKQQLAEKEQETKQLKRDLGMYKSVNEFINRYGIEKAREVLLQTERTKKQDKTDFAIEQLEKVKYDFFNISNGWWLCFRDGTQYMTHRELEACVIDVIDNQIQELKKVKNEK
ncbi:MAG: hypothetical protein ACLRFR_02000 [Clostridia bacterium]